MTLTSSLRASRPVVLTLASLTLAACEATKSSNPLSPSVAGPIGGVSITAPRQLEPAQGVKFKESQQPIRLVVENSTSNGQRPITYSFEVSADSSFATRVFARSAVPPGDGRTSVQVDRLDLGKGYYWRVRAEDGANTSTYSTSQFEVLPKAQLGTPGTVSPSGNERVTSRRPTFTASNSTRNAGVGDLSYEFHVALDQAFTQIVASSIVGEGPGQTTFTPSNDLATDKQHFWRVRSTDGETTSAWASTQTFMTPVAAAPSPSPSPTPGPTGNCDSLVNDKEALVKCIHAQILPHDEVTGFEVTKRVAWALRGERAGLLIKNGGENIVAWQGYSFSAGRICYPDGHIFKVLSDVGPGGANGPTWSDNGFVDPSLYVPAIDPSKR
jgi:hypothetical protein